MSASSHFHSFELIVSAPVGVAKPSLAVAAAHAGVRGLLDINQLSANAVSVLLHRYSAVSEAPLILRCSQWNIAELAKLLDKVDIVSVLLISPEVPLRRCRQLRKAGYQLWLDLDVVDVALGQHRLAQVVDAVVIRMQGTLDGVDLNSAELPIYADAPALNEEALTSFVDAGFTGAILSEQLLALRESGLTVRDKAMRSIPAHASQVAERYHSLSRLLTAWQQRLEQHSGQSIHSNCTSAAKPTEIAIIGIECILPKADSRDTYWENIVNGVNGLGEVPSERWSTDLYFDADKQAKDKIYSRWGGFIDEVPFDPLAFGMPPNSLRAIDPMQLLALKVAKAALDDAGYGVGDHKNTGVILGASGGVGDIGTYYLARSMLPTFVGDASAEILGNLPHVPEWTEDSFAGLLPNVSAGRIANRLDFGGVNFVVDAACGSSLAAVHLAVKELVQGEADMMVVGGVDTVQSPFGFMCFSKTTALSPNGVPRVFDEAGDGIVISEGVVMLVMKRLADAERDGDRIYAVVQGSAGSSDGKALGMTAPRPEGQMLALERVYTRSGIDPKTVGLFEAHGTGTAVGDRTEAQSLGRFLSEQGAPANRYPLGSVKSMIGHTKAAAGVAGLAKIALALHHKVLPPTLNVNTPNPKSNFGTGPLYVNSEARPWVHGGGAPRRAAVSAFGFGGTNFHVLAEEYRGGFYGDAPTMQQRTSELLVFSGEDSAEISTRLSLLGSAIDAGATPKLIDLAFTLWTQYESSHPVRLAIVANSVEHLRSRLKPAMAGPDGETQDGIFWRNAALQDDDGKVAFLFPGQGSQYTNMLRDVALQFDEVRDAFDEADAALGAQLEQPLSLFVFPQPAFDDDTREAQKGALTMTDVAQPALGAAGVGMLRLLTALGVTPQMAAGHSYGEYVALHAAGVIDAATLITLSEARGRCIVEAAADGLGTMAAISADVATVKKAIAKIKGVWLANLNAPLQTIISGTEAGIAEALEKLAALDVSVRPIPVAAAFHSPIVAPAQTCFADHLDSAEFNPPQFDVYANTSAKPHKRTARSIRRQLNAHLAKPVRFVEQIEAMYADGARVFVECGPRDVLTKLTKRILGERPHVAINLDHHRQDGVTQLHLALGQLLASGVDVELDRLFAGRKVSVLDTRRLVEATQPKPLTPTTWMLSGGAVRPLHEARIVVSAEMLNAKFAQVIGKSKTIAPPSDAAPTNQPIVAQQKDDSHSGDAPMQPAVPPAMLPPQSDPSIVSSYHSLMRHFLEMQQQIMTAALGGVAMPAQPAAQPADLPAPPLPLEQVDLKRKEQKSEQVLKPSVHSVPRSILADVLVAPPVYRAQRFSAEKPILITNDGRGIAQELARRIEAAGGSAVIDGMMQAGWGGVIHLAPLSNLSAVGTLDSAQWRTATQQSVKALLGYTQQLAGERPFLLAATATDHNPIHGGVSGFIKTAAQELPDSRMQCIDVDALNSAEAIADQIWSELNAEGAPTIVRYRQGLRYAQRQIALPIDNKRQRTDITGEDVILVTGGARGITAQVALAVAQQTQATLILVGRSPLVEAPESEATAGLRDKALKAALIAQAKATGGGVSLPAIEHQFNQLLKQREMRANIAAIEATGATVRYFAADVRNADAMTAVFAESQKAFGPVSGVIHGAGIIEDKLIAAKSAESFDRVFDTKADSLFVLTQLVDPAALKFMALFSSAAGALGNRGQCDYAAANDLMNHVAAYLDARWSAHVVACCWGPWATEGMVSPELEAQFAELGIEMIDIAAGCQALLGEIQHGSDAVAIYAGGSWGGSAEFHLPVATLQSAFPLVNQADVMRTKTFVRLTRRFDPAVDTYLDHHRLDDIPVLPMAVASDWMMSVVQTAFPNMQVAALRDLTVLAGIKFVDDAPRRLRVEARLASARLEDVAVVAVRLLDDATDREHYRASVHLVQTLPKPPKHVLPDTLEKFGRTVPHIYETWLFHGPVFQAITQVDGIDAENLLMTVQPSDPANAVQDADGLWLLDPVIVDAGLQGALVWAREQMDVTPVPLGFHTLERFAPVGSTSLQAHLQFIHDDVSQTLSINITFVNAANQIVARLIGAHGQYASAFNRLGGHEKYAPFAPMAG